jgi:hypothetical protein
LPVKNCVSIQLAGAGLGLLLGNACFADPGPGPGVGVSGDGDVASETEGDDVGDGDGDSGDGDGDGDGESGDGDGDGGSGDGDGDGDSGTGITEACTQACALVESCMPGLDACFDNCVGRYVAFADDPECAAAELAVVECVSGLTCEEFEHFLNEAPEPTPCQAERDQTCFPPPVCTVDIGPGNDVACDTLIVCHSGKREYRVECDHESCICFQDGVETGSCGSIVGCHEPGSSTLETCCDYDV